MNFTFTVLLFLVLLGEVTSECCGGGQCGDGTRGNPYCGVGKCNIFGCNCNGGCRKGSAYKPCCHAAEVARAPVVLWPVITAAKIAAKQGIKQGVKKGSKFIPKKLGKIIEYVPDPSDLIYHVASLRCRDGTRGSPYCGVGKCNIFGCNCDGGCRE